MTGHSLNLADFQAALEEYQPTQQKAESYQRSVDPFTAMASAFAASLSGLPQKSNDSDHGSSSNGCDNLNGSNNGRSGKA